MKITSKSHIDHGLRPEHIDFIEKRYLKQKAFFIETIEMPGSLRPLPCTLVGPLTGHPPVNASEVEFRRRGDRIVPSRMFKPEAAVERRFIPPSGRVPMSRKLTVIGGVDSESGECILFTAYGGPLAPREVGDPLITDADELAKSFHFWREHALLEIE